jgi:UV DNA damage endonuclease
MERRAHADRCENLPADLPDDMGKDVMFLFYKRHELRVGIDLMIEAKDKEQAVFHLYRMYDLQPVIHGGSVASFYGHQVS